MRTSLSTLVRLFLVAATHVNTARSVKIAWSPCQADGTTVPLSCGSLSVPLDYTDEQSDATLNLQLLRLPAANSPSKGSILLNFGGPGIDGVLDITIYGTLLQVLTGGYHDLVVFQPRGTGNTIRFSCYNSSVERTLAQLQVVAGKASDVALGKLWGNTQILANTCYAARKETGTFLGTAFVARDVMRIVDALGEDGMLRYWGFSYGTVLGATIAAMFPGRMDKIILDGVVNPHEYYQNREVEMFKDADKVFAGFCSGCVADPSRCTLAHNHTSSSLQETLHSFFFDLKYNPIVVPIPGGEALLEYTLMKQLLLLNLYSPFTWPSFASFWDGLLSRNMSAVAEYTAKLFSSSPLSADEALAGIKCSDTYAPATAAALEQVLPVIKARHRQSDIVGDAADHIPMQCAQWRARAKEQYKGDFRALTKNPVLLIGNTGDPVTPLASARNLSKALVGSVLLQHGGYGHSSLAQASLCTAKATRAYFVNGTLPKAGTVCDVHVPLFAGTDGYEDVLKHFETGGNATVTKRESAMPLVGRKLPRPFFGII